MVFIACGMGGGTGTGAAPAVARVAREAGCLTVAVVSKPFFFEGLQRMRIAEQGIEELKQSVDAIIIIPNDRLLATVDKETTAKNAFAMCDDILRRAVEGISDLVTTPGLINIDFADVRTVMENAGPALMGIGYSTGEKRAEEAARSAINSPLLEVSVAGAKGVLFSIAGGDDLTMFEIQDAAKIITESVDPNAKIIFGTVRDERLKKGELKITVIASGFPEALTKKTLFQQENAMPMAEDKKGKIYNSVPLFGGSKEKESSMSQMDEKPPSSHASDIPSSQSSSKPKDESEEDDWGAVPAFLRRSKLK